MTEPLPDQPQRAPRFDAWIAMIITLGVFAVVLATPYSIVDDRVMLRDNPDLIHPTWAGFWKQLSTPQHNIYAPLTYGLWYAIAAASSDGESLPVIGFKVVSWIGHGFAALAAWWVVWLLVRNRAAAMLGALFVTLHPLQVESVAWTTGTKDVLCGVFSFAAIALYLRAITGGRRRNVHWAVICGVLAVAAKPTGVVLPAILLAADWAARDVSIQKRLADLWPFLPASAIGVLIIINVQPALTITPAPLHLRPLIALDSYAFYLQKTVLPTSLAVDYARTTEWLRGSGQLAWTWIIPLTAAALVAVSRSRLLALAAVLFIIPILPVSGIVPFDMQQYTTVTDHYAYQSLLGVGLVLAIAVRRMVIAKAVTAIVVVALAALSIVRVGYWRDPQRLYNAGIEVAPDSVMSRGALVTIAFDQDNPAEAERLLREIIATRPRGDAYVNLSVALIKQHRLREAGDVASEGLGLNTLVLTVENLRYWLLLAKELKDSDLAHDVVARWVMLEPENPAPRKLMEQIDAARAREAAARPATQPLE